MNILHESILKSNTYSHAIAMTHLRTLTVFYPNMQFIPKRSALFEPNNAIEEDDEEKSDENMNTMVLVDVENESERFDSVSPTEKYRLMSPWEAQTSAQANNLVSDIEALAISARCSRGA